MIDASTSTDRKGISRPRLWRCHSLFLVALACSTAIPQQTPSPADRAGGAREAWRSAAASQRAGEPDSVWAHVRRAHNAWPAQPAYSEALARLAALRRDVEVLEQVLRTLAAQEAGLGVARDTAVRTAAQRTPSTAAAFAELQRRVAANELSNPRTLSEDTTFFPEGLSADPRTGTIYITSLRHRMVYALAPSGAMQPAISVVRGDVAAPFGVAVDSARELLWVTTAGVPHMEGYQPSDSARAELLQVRRSDGAISGRWKLGTGKGTPGELTLTPKGDVLISDAVLGVLYRLRSGAGAIEVIENPLVRSPQGIASDETSEVAWVADWTHGLLRWNLATDEITAVQTPDDVTLLGIDGLRRVNGRLIGVQNGIAPARIVGIELDESGSSVQSVLTLDRPSNMEGEPTVGTVLGDRYVYVSSSAWPFWTDDGRRRSNSGPLPPVVIREMRLLR